MTEVAAPTGNAPAPMTGPAIPEIEDPELVDGEVVPKDAEPEDDIDPNDWLAGSSDTPSTFVDYAVIPGTGKRMKMAALTDAEHTSVQRASRKRDKTDPKRIKMDQNEYARLFIATALSKAKGVALGQPGAVNPDALKVRPAGELQQLLREAMRISGMDVTPNRPDPNDFFV